MLILLRILISLGLLAMPALQRATFYGQNTTGGSTATWSTIQTVEVGYNNSACSGSTCSATISAFGSGHLLFVETSLDPGDDTISIANVNIGGTWVFPAGCHVNNTGVSDSLRCAYVLSSTTGGGTTLTVTLSSAPVSAWAMMVSERSKSSGSITLDGSILASASHSCSGTTCTPGAVSITGTSDIVINIVGDCSGGTINSVAAPYGNYKGIYSTELDAYGDNLSTSSGNGGAFTSSGSGDIFEYLALAFK
jgi:hypothetical protein